MARAKGRRAPRRRAAAPPAPAEIVVRIKETGAATASVRESLGPGEGRDVVHPLDAVLALYPGVSGRPLFSAEAGVEYLRTERLKERRLTWVLPTDDVAKRQSHPGLNVIELPAGAKADAVARMLRADPRVDYAHVPAPRHEVDASVAAQPGETARQWALDRCGFPRAWKVTDPLWGPPTQVAVVDSGIDTAHPDLQTVTRLFTFGLSTDDETGHGTSVAGLLAAVRGNHVGIGGGARCGLEIYKVFGAGSRFLHQGYYSALEFLARSDVRVINLSIGGTKDDPTERALIRACLAAGKVVVAPMGNSTEFGPGATLFPACLPQVIAVASTDEGDAHAPFSITGDHVWLAAPGTGLLTTLRGGDFGPVTGTSYSTPLVSAACALLCRRWPDLDPVRVRSLLAKLVVPVGGQVGWLPSVGHGRLDIGKLAEL